MFPEIYNLNFYIKTPELLCFPGTFDTRNINVVCLHPNIEYTQIQLVSVLSYW